MVAKGAVGEGGGRLPGSCQVHLQDAVLPTTPGTAKPPQWPTSTALSVFHRKVVKTRWLASLPLSFDGAVSALQPLGRAERRGSECPLQVGLKWQ